MRFRHPNFIVLDWLYRIVAMVAWALFAAMEEWLPASLLAVGFCGIACLTLARLTWQRRWRCLLLATAACVMLIIYGFAYSSLGQQQLGRIFPYLTGLGVASAGLFLSCHLLSWQGGFHPESDRPS
jgi:hypothetical protein